MVDKILQYVLGVPGLLFLVLGYFSKHRRWSWWTAAICALSAAAAAHYDTFWVLATFSLGMVWALVCTLPQMDFGWRLKTGLVAAMGLGAFLCVWPTLEGVTDAGRFADLVAGYLDVKPTDRQALLETLSVEDRLRRVLVHVQRQIGVADAQEEIKSQVQEELGERQREMLLREQMKAIRKELGEDDEATEVEELRKRFLAIQLPEAARKEVDRELSRLERASRDSMEAQVIRTYLETMAELPWDKRVEESLDLKRAAEILEQDHFGLTEVKDQVLEFLAVRQLRQKEVASAAPGNEDDKQPKGHILLFVGPPGVGKTSIAKSIARAMGRPYVRISLGGEESEQRRDAKKLAADLGGN